MESVYLALLLFQFGIGALYIGYNGGIQKHTYFSFCLTLYFFYLWLAGFNTWSGNKMVTGNFSIEDIFDEGLLYYNIALFFFILGYILGRTWHKPFPFFRQERPFNDKALIQMTIVFLILNYAFRFTNTGIEGSLETYLFLTQDFLIILTIGVYSRKLNSWFFYFTLASSIFLFSSNFFRYRIILTLLGIGLIYIKRNPEILKKIGKYLVILTAATYAILFFTVNRKPLADNDLENVRFNLLDPDPNLERTVSSEGSNLATDFMVLKLYRDDPSYPHDFGKTMFVFPFIRALPGNLFPGGIKPYPPSLTTIIDAYGGTREAANAGRAVTNVVELYIAFGWPGTIFFMFIFGILLKSLQNRWVMDGSFNELLQIAILVSLFQYITRGYFPQYLTHISYLIVPVFLLRRLSRNENPERIVYRSQVPAKP